MSTSSIILSVSNIILVLSTIWYAKKTAEIVAFMKKSFYTEHKGIIVFDDVSVDIIKDVARNQTGLQVKYIFTNYGKVPTRLNVDSLTGDFHSVIPREKWKEFNTVLAPMEKITIFSPIVFLMTHNIPVFLHLRMEILKFHIQLLTTLGTMKKINQDNHTFFNKDNKFQTRWFFDNS
ncbi:MAG: hypothetical protein ACYCS8_13265 [Acidithiobacillus sp.]